MLQLSANTAELAQAAVSLSFALEVPRDAAADDDLIIRNNITGEEAFTARVSECTPTLSAAVLIRIKMFVQRMLEESLQELSAQAAANLGRSGY